MKTFNLKAIYGQNDLKCDDARGLRHPWTLYCERHYNLYSHPLPVSCGWHIVNGRCRPILDTKSALPEELSFVTSHPANEEDDSKWEDDDTGCDGDSRDSDEN